MYIHTTVFMYGCTHFDSIAKIYSKSQKSRLKLSNWYLIACGGYEENRPECIYRNIQKHTCTSFMYRSTIRKCILQVTWMHGRNAGIIGFMTSFVWSTLTYLLLVLPKHAGKTNSPKCDFFSSQLTHGSAHSSSSLHRHFHNSTSTDYETSVWIRKSGAAFNSSLESCWFKYSLSCVAHRSTCQVKR